MAKSDQTKTARRQKPSRKPKVVGRKAEGRAKRATRALPAPPIPAFVSSYDRSAALSFARAFWTKVCPDLHVGIASSPGAKAVQAGTVFERFTSGPNAPEVAKSPNGTIISSTELNDCAHFVSCCLGKPPGQTAGGLDIPSEFGNAYGLFGANKLFEFLKGAGLIQIIQAENLTHAQAAAKLSSLSEGDAIFYKRKNQTIYGHVGVYLAGTSKHIACHTYCRADVDAQHPFAQTWDSVKFAGTETLYTLTKIL